MKPRAHPFRGNVLLLAALCAATLVGAAVRAKVLDHPMRYDESYNYLNYASRSPGYILTHYTPNNHVLHTLMVCVSSRILGDAPAALRLPAFVAGVLLIPAAAWLAWTVGRSRLAAVFAAMAVAGSSPLVEYSASARGYSWLALCATVLTVLTVKLAREPDRFALRAAWVAVAACGAFTIPVMSLPITGCLVVMAIALWRTRRDPIVFPAARRTLLFCGFGCVALICGLYLPIMIAEGPRKLLATHEMATGILGAQIDSFSVMATAASALSVRHAPPLWLGALAVGVVASIVVAMRPKDRRDGIIPLVIVMVSLILVAAAGAPLPARAWLFAIPLLLVVAANGLAWVVAAIPHRASANALGSVVAVAALFAIAGTTAQPRLCAEPGGVVEIEPALLACRDFGSDRCAVLSRYTPAAAYYARRLKLEPLVQPQSPSTQHVLIVADEARPLTDLWGPHVDGYHNFSPPRLSQPIAAANLYIADRVPTVSAR